MSQMDMEEGPVLGNRAARRSARRRLSVTAESVRRLDFIWNSSLVCPFQCGDCCVSAIHTLLRNGQGWMSDNELGVYTSIGIRPKDATPHWPYDEAARHLQRTGLELDLAGKLSVLENINVEGVSSKVDISGGDCLTVSETKTVIRHAAERLGRDNVTVTATGIGLSMVDPADLAPYVGEVNITFDGTPPKKDPLRPNGYALANLREGVRLTQHGIKVRAEIPLTLQNIDQVELERIYRALATTDIGTLLVMRLFPVGRGELHTGQIPDADQYRSAITLLRRLEDELNGPTVKLQCALRHLDGDTSGPNPCDAVRESFGIMADGTLLASPWAINRHGRPVDDLWVLGNLATTPITEILASDRVARFQEHLDDNPGHCKIFADRYGNHPDPSMRMFQNADPLYTDPAPTTADTAA